MVGKLGKMDNTDRGMRRLDVKIQDKYSVRCTPQRIGALNDTITWIRQTLTVELNSANDNPLYDVDEGLVRSGGNFSGFHVGLGMCCTHPLPEDHPEAGTHHGFKGAQLAISALTAEALNACNPMSSTRRTLPRI